MYDTAPTRAALIDNMWQPAHLLVPRGQCAWRWWETSQGMKVVLASQTRELGESKRVKSDPSLCLSELMAFSAWKYLPDEGWCVVMFSYYGGFIGSWKSAGCALIYQNEEVDATWGRKRVTVHIQMTTAFVFKKYFFVKLLVRVDLFFSNDTAFILKASN